MARLFRLSPFALAIDALLLLAAGVTGWRYLPVGTTLHQTKTVHQTKHVAVRLELGSHLRLPGVQWTAAPRHVILVVQTTCPACNAGVEFYRDLVARCRSSQIDETVMSSEPQDVLREWFERKSIPMPSAFVQTDLVGIGLGAVPTILIADRAGIVTDIAAGTLDAPVRAAVLFRVDGASSVPVNNKRYARLIDAQDVAQLLSGAPPVFLDVALRGQLGSSRPGDIAIPADELESRAPAEVSLSNSVVIDCSTQRLRQCDAAADILMNLGAPRVFVFVPDLKR